MWISRSESVESTFKEKQLRNRVRELEAYVEELERAALLRPANEPPKTTLTNIFKIIAKEKPF